MKRLVGAAAVLLLVLGVSAQAGPDVSAWIGRMSGEDLLISGTRTFGFAAGFSFARYFGFEAVFEYIPDSELPFDLEELEELLDVDVRVDLYSLSGNLLLQYPVSDTILPYGTIGYGAFGAHATGEYQGETPEAWGATTALNFGFGVKVKLARFIAVRGDIRWYRLNISVENLGDLVEGVENPTLSRMAVGATFSF